MVILVKSCKRDAIIIYVKWVIMLPRLKTQVVNLSFSQLRVESSIQPINQLKNKEDFILQNQLHFVDNCQAQPKLKFNLRLS
jgi:hypothetical protein